MLSPFIFIKRFSSISHSKSISYIFFISTLLIISGCSEPTVEVKDSNTYYQSAKLATISPQQSFVIDRTYIGQIKAKQHTSLSFEYSGKVIEVHVDNGDIVKKGDVLAKQNIALLNYKTDELHAQIEQANAQISLNIANLKRIKSLVIDGYSSEQQLDELNSENKVLSAQIVGLNAKVKTINYQIEKASLTAPFDGVISSRLLSNGEIAPASKPAFKIIKQSDSEINVGVPNKIARELILGQIFNIEIEEQINQAELIAIGQQIDSHNRTVQLRLKMLNKARSFNGQIVRVSIEQKINKVGFWLPISAITDGVRGQWQVFLVEKTNKENTEIYQIKSTTIQVLHANDISVYVSGLLLKDHTIVNEGIHRFVNKQFIKAAPLESILATSHLENESQNTLGKSL